MKLTESLLTTKLFIPSTRPELVSRPRLVERLNGGLHHKLTLISAPAGFGKTTLVSEWVENLRLAAKKENQIENRIAWLSLDESENDPARFLTYLIAALNQVEGIDATFGKGALSMLQSPQPPPTETILTSLINEIATIPDRIILVLDDYHLIDAQPIHDALTFHLEHLPQQMHLVIATREDPHLPLARLRAKDQLTELRATDLRFTPSEAAEFLNQVMGLNLSADDITALESRTEGWIAGLQLAAISLQGREDVTSLVRSFAGSHQYVLDYLIEEVLNLQSENTLSFLLQTSILDRLTGSLCDALTGQHSGQATLEMLEHANLFIVPLDDERRWYRYHHLFSDLLRRRLRQTQLEQIPTLHHQASEWYEQNGFTDEAIVHALQGEDFERAARLIEEHADALWGRGEHAKLRRWLEKLPIELVFSKPDICIFHAWYHYSIGELDTAEKSLQAAEQASDSSTDHVTESESQEQVSITNYDRVKLRGRAAVIRAFMGAYRGDVPGIIQHARQALEYLPEQDLTWRSIATNALADAHAYKGDMTAAYEARFEALKACKAAGDIYLNIITNLKLAITLRSQGQLQRTIEICQQQIQFASEFGLSQTRAVGWMLAIWGEVLAEFNDLDGAIDKAKKGVELTEGGGDLAMIGWSYMSLMRIIFSRGDMVGAEEIIQKMENVARESKVPPWFTNLMAAWQTQMWLVQDKLEEASQWALERRLDTDGESKLQHEIDYFLLFEYILYGRILIAQGRLDETTTLLQRLLEAAETGGRTSRVIEILILQALVLEARGDTDQAVTTLEKALTLAEPEGFIRIFVDEDQPMARLLYEALNRGIAPDHISRLLSAFPMTESEQTDPSKIQTPKSELVEPLSEREIEVLQLIAEGLTNQEVASRLYLAQSTIKVHTRNIYGKLGVNNRTQAVARARALGILPSL
jgi:LuxR family maltose regulon positive regulatory protein